MRYLRSLRLQNHRQNHCQWFTLLLTLALCLAACSTVQPAPSSSTPLSLQVPASPSPAPSATHAVADTASTPAVTPTIELAATMAVPAGPPINRGLPTATPGPNGPGPTATPIPGAAQYQGDARFAYTDSGNIYTFESETAKARQLTKVELGNWATDPAWSPDGKTIVYSLQIAPRNGQLAYADLVMMDPDGNNQRVLVAHDMPGAILERPIWSSDGKSIYIAYSRPIFENGRYKDVVQEIDQVALVSGKRTTLVENALYPSVDKSGRYITYFDNVDSDLWIAELSNPKQTARQLIRQDEYTLLYAPRISPDGTKLIFITAGTSTQGMGSRILPGRASGILSAPPQHGLPVDLWMLDIAGGETKQVTKYLLDSPYPTWSADGSKLAFISANGLYVLNPDGSDLSIVSPMALHGEIDWAPH